MKLVGIGDIDLIASGLFVLLIVHLVVNSRKSGTSPTKLG